MREWLIFVLKLLGKRNVFHRSGATHFDERSGNVVEAAAPPRSDVDYGVACGAASEEEIHVHNVAHKYKIAPLFAITILAAPLKHLDRASFLELVGKARDDGGHRALMALARAVHVEIAESDDGAVGRGGAPADIIVEHELRKTGGRRIFDTARAG